jgi:dipeptidyl aminopeptidase/acylaminoacyl peptidase
MQMISSFRSFLLCSLLFPTFVHAQTGDRLTPERLWKMGRAALEDVSPDGTMALYGVTYFTLETNKSARDLYLVPVSGGTPKKLTAFEGSKENARFRPDGRRIGYLRNGLLWEMNPDGSDQVQVSDIEMGGFLYRPDGKGILYLQDVKYDPTVKDVYPDLPLATGRIIDGLMYRHWKSWHDHAYGNVFWSAYENGRLTGAPVNIQREPFDSPLAPMGGIEQLAWSPDGRTIA